MRKAPEYKPSARVRGSGKWPEDGSPAGTWAVALRCRPAGLAEMRPGLEGWS